MSQQPICQRQSTLLTEPFITLPASMSPPEQDTESDEPLAYRDGEFLVDYIQKRAAESSDSRRQSGSRPCPVRDSTDAISETFSALHLHGLSNEASCSLPESSIKELLDRAAASYNSFLPTNHRAYIDAAVDGYQQAFLATSIHDAFRSERQYLLASALICRYRNTDAIFQDLERSIRLAEQVVADAPDMVQRLNAQSLLGWGYYMRFLRVGHVPDIVAAVDSLETVAALAHCPKRWLVLLRLALATHVRFLACAGEEHIRRAEHIARYALSENHPVEAEPMLQDALSRVLCIKYRNSMSPSGQDIIEAHEAADRALKMTPKSHIHYAAYCQNLCRLYFYRIPEGKTDEDGLSVGMKAFRNLPDGYRRRFPIAYCVSNLSDIKCSREGRPEDLADAMSWASISAKTPEKFYKPTFEVGLCRWLIRRFEQYGQPTDDDAAIDMLLPIANSISTQGIDNIQFARHYIVYAYYSRFLWHGDENDLNECIRIAELSAASSMQGQREHGTDLARYRAYFARYRLKGSLSDLEYGLVKTAETMPKTEVAWHAMEPSDTWTTLGDMYFSRYKELGDQDDFNEGVRWCRRVLENDHIALIDRTQAFHLLAVGFTQRFRVNDSMEDLQQATDFAERCVTLVPPCHALRAEYVAQLGDLYVMKHDRLSGAEDLQRALVTYRTAAVDFASVVQHRFRAATVYATLAHRNNQLEAALEGYTVAIELLPRLAWLGMDHEARFKYLLSGASTLACDAAACACALGMYEKAIVLLESGRAIFWQQQVSLLNPNYEQVLAQQPVLAAELQTVGRALEIATQPGNDPETGIRNRRRLAAQWDALVERIRSLEGFKNFLMPMTFEDLRTPASKGGTPIFINISRFGSAALILKMDDPVHYISLPNATHERVKLLANTLHKAVSLPKDKLGSVYLERIVRSIMVELWKDIGAPIWEVLSTLGLPPLPRVWWIATGPLVSLPIHAASPASPDEPGFPDLITSSYSIVLQSLVRSLRNHDDERAGLRVLMIAQCKAAGFRELPSVKEELSVLRQTLPEASLDVLEGGNATVANVKAALTAARWVHFACHGHQDQVDPMRSCLVLADGPLTMRALIADRFEDAYSFAFLSACHTARGMQDLPDEVLHIAAALKLAGFGAIVGSAWAIADKDAPRVASRFYRYLLREERTLDPGRTAEALRVTITGLRRAGVPAHRWVPFIHVGR